MLVCTGLYWRRDEVGRWGMKKRDFKEKGLQIRVELRCMESLRKAYNQGFISCMHNSGFITAPKSYFVKRQVQWLILCHILNELMHIPQFTQVIRWWMFYLARNFKYSLSHSVGYSFIHSFIRSHNKHLLSIQSVPGTVLSLWVWHQLKPAYRCLLERQDVKSADKMPLAMLNGRGRQCSIIQLFSQHLMNDSCAYTWLAFCMLRVRKRHSWFSCSSKLLDQGVRSERPKCYGQRWLQHGTKSYKGRDNRYQGRTPYQEQPGSMYCSRSPSPYF